MLPLLLIVAAAPDAGRNAPTPREMAQLYFLAGDLRRAIDAGRRCLQLEGKKKCEPLYRALVEYEALIRKSEQLSPAEARAYLQWDKLISPQEPGKLTRPVIERYISRPVEASRLALEAGDLKAARAGAERVLEVDPQNPDAARLLGELTRRGDAGTR